MIFFLFYNFKDLVWKDSKNHKTMKYWLITKLYGLQTNKSIVSLNRAREREIN